MRLEDGDMPRQEVDDAESTNIVLDFSQSPLEIVDGVPLELGFKVSRTKFGASPIFGVTLKGPRGLSPIVVTTSTSEIDVFLGLHGNATGFDGKIILNWLGKE